MENQSLRICYLYWQVLIGFCLLNSFLPFFMPSICLLIYYPTAAKLLKILFLFFFKQLSACCSIICITSRSSGSTQFFSLLCLTFHRDKNKGGNLLVVLKPSCWSHNDQWWSVCFISCRKLPLQCVNSVFIDITSPNIWQEDQGHIFTHVQVIDTHHGPQIT